MRWQESLRIIGRHAWWCMLPFLMACAGPYRGAALAAPGDVPRGHLVKTFARTACTHPHVHAPSTYVDYVQGTDGVPFIVERGQTNTWLIITNSRIQGDAIVFQTVRRREPAEVREYRFPVRSPKPGRFTWSNHFEPPTGSTHRFETKPKGTIASCDLIPVDPLTGAPLTMYGTEKAPSSGWGYDGSSFRVGNVVLVDEGERLLRAEVLRAPGGMYFVRQEGVPEGGGRWIDPSTIVGTLE